MKTTRNLLKVKLGIKVMELVEFLIDMEVIDRPKSVHNRCVIDVFGDVFVLSRCFLDFICGCRVFFSQD